MTRKVLCRFMHMIAGCLLLQPNNACYSKQKTKKKTLRIHVTRSKGALIFLFVFFAFFFCFCFLFLLRSRKYDKQYRPHKFTKCSIRNYFLLVEFSSYLNRDSPSPKNKLKREREILHFCL